MLSLNFEFSSSLVVGMYGRLHPFFLNVSRDKITRGNLSFRSGRSGSPVITEEPHPIFLFSYVQELDFARLCSVFCTCGISNLLAPYIRTRYLFFTYP